MNISKKTRIDGLEKTFCKIGHIEYCLNARGMHEPPKYDYFGRYVSRGHITLHTKNGDFTAEFKEKSGWLEYLIFE